MKDNMNIIELELERQPVSESNQATSCKRTTRRMELLGFDDYGRAILKDRRSVRRQGYKINRRFRGSLDGVIRSTGGPFEGQPLRYEVLSWRTVS